MCSGIGSLFWHIFAWWLRVYHAPLYMYTFLGAATCICNIYIYLSICTYVYTQACTSLLPLAAACLWLLALIYPCMPFWACPWQCQANMWSRIWALNLHLHGHQARVEAGERGQNDQSSSWNRMLRNALPEWAAFIAFTSWAFITSMFSFIRLLFWRKVVAKARWDFAYCRIVSFQPGSSFFNIFFWLRSLCDVRMIRSCLKFADTILIWRSYDSLGFCIYWTCDQGIRVTVMELHLLSEICHGLPEHFRSIAFGAWFSTDSADFPISTQAWTHLVQNCCAAPGTTICIQLQVTVALGGFMGTAANCQQIAQIKRCPKIYHLQCNLL